MFFLVFFNLTVLFSVLQLPYIYRFPNHFAHSAILSSVLCFLFLLLISWIPLRASSLGPYSFCWALSHSASLLYGLCHSHTISSPGHTAPAALIAIQLCLYLELPKDTQTEWHRLENQTHFYGLHLFVYSLIWLTEHLHWDNLQSLYMQQIYLS